MDRPAQPPSGQEPPAQPGSNPLARLSAITGNHPPAQVPAAGNGTPAAPEASSPPRPRTLGRLTPVQAEQLWPTDAAFAAWLAENLEAVSEVASLPLRAAELLRGDTPVILAATEGGASAVVVPQRAASTDVAFGAMVRHFAASAAQHAVWICGDPSSEHAAAVSWLNRAVDGRFVMLRVGAVTIGDSAAAPTFELAVRSPRRDDAGVESVLPEGSVDADVPERRADDWPAGVREKAD
jgi:hypothetical protein